MNIGSEEEKYQSEEKYLNSLKEAKTQERYLAQCIHKWNGQDIACSIYGRGPKDYLLEAINA